MCLWMIRRKPLCRLDLRRQGGPRRPKPFAGNDLGQNIKFGQTDLEDLRLNPYNGKLQGKFSKISRLG